MWRVRYREESPVRWLDVDGYDIADAINIKHLRDHPYCPGITYRHNLPEGGLHHVHFTVFEIENGEVLIGSPTLISRIFITGIWRSGGVRHETTLADVAKYLGWSKDPNELMLEWDGEETWEAAKAQRAHRR